MRWFMIRKCIFTTPHPLLLQRPPLSSPDTREKVGNKRRRCLSFELHRSEVLSKRSQVPIFLRSEEEERGRGRRGVNDDRWRWRRAEKVLEEEKQRGRKSKSMDLLDTFYVFDEVDWFLPSAALRSHSLPLPRVMLPKTFQPELETRKAAPISNVQRWLRNKVIREEQDMFPLESIPKALQINTL